MFTVQESKIANNTVVITTRMIDRFRCADARSVSCDMAKSSGS